MAFTPRGQFREVRLNRYVMLFLSHVISCTQESNHRKHIDFLYPEGYNEAMIEIRQTETYRKWFRSLKDRTARARIDIRVRRLSLGNSGDAKSVGQGVSELRIDYGPGYRVYFLQRRNIVVILLCGGDKSSQKRDIQRAYELAKQVED